MAADRAPEAVVQRARVADAGAEDAGRDPLGDGVPRCIDRLCRVARLLAGDTFAPGGRAVRVFELEEQDPPAGRAAGRDLERLAQRHPDFPQRNARQPDAHRARSRDVREQIVRVVRWWRIQEAGHAVPAGQEPGKGAAVGLLPARGPVRIGRLQGADVGRRGDAHPRAGGERMVGGRVTRVEGRRAVRRGRRRVSRSGQEALDARIGQAPTPRRSGPWPDRGAACCRCRRTCRQRIPPAGRRVRSR